MRIKNLTCTVFINVKIEKLITTFPKKQKGMIKMKILNKFSEEQKQILKDNNIDIDKDFDEKSLEKLENKVYNKMMDNLDKNQDFTIKALKWEKILENQSQQKRLYL